MSFKEDFKEYYLSNKKEINWLSALTLISIVVVLIAVLSPSIEFGKVKEFKEARQESTVLVSEITNLVKESEGHIDTLTLDMAAEELEAFITEERDRTVEIGEKGIELSQKINTMELGVASVASPQTADIFVSFIETSALFFNETTDVVDENSDLISLLQRRVAQIESENASLEKQIENNKRDAERLYEAKDKYDQVLSQIETTGY